MKPPVGRRCACVAALALLTAGCSTLSPTKPPPCPPILVFKDASRLVAYRDGPGRDITDIVTTARLADFLALCDYDRKRTEADIDLTVTFDIRRGPANRAGKSSFSWFFAIPHFYPAPEGKRVFKSTVAFKGNQDRLTYRERISVAIPIDPKKPLSTYTGYLGFQLTPQQVEENRKKVAP